MTAPNAILLFAAGFGTRMGALTADRPKPLIPVAGRSLLDHALALSDAAGIARKVVNSHYKADQIAAHLADRPDIALSHETPDILDTGGGLRQALPLLGPGPVYTLNTDAVWTGPNPLATLGGAWSPARMDALLLLIPRVRALGHRGAGDFLRAGERDGGRDGESDGGRDGGRDGGLDGAERLTRGPGEVYTGAQIIAPDRLAAHPPGAFSLNGVWDAIAAEGRLYGVLHPGGWCDVGRPDGIARAEAMLAGQP